MVQTQKIGVIQVAVSDEDANHPTTFSYTLILLSLFPYPARTITIIHVLLETSCLTWFSS